MSDRKALLYFPSHWLGLSYKGRLKDMNVPTMATQDPDEAFKFASDNLDDLAVAFVSEYSGCVGDRNHTGVDLAGKLRNDLGYEGPIVYVWFKDDWDIAKKSGHFQEMLNPPISGDRFFKVAKEYLGLNQEVKD